MARSSLLPMVGSTRANITTSCCERPKVARWPDWARARLPLLAGWEMGAGVRRLDAAEARPLSDADPARSGGSLSIVSSRSGSPTGFPTADRFSSAATGSGKPPAATFSRSRRCALGRSPRWEPAPDSSRPTVRRSWRGVPPRATAGIRSREEAAARSGALVRRSGRSLERRWAGAHRREHDLTHPGPGRSRDGPPGGGRHPRDRAPRSPVPAGLLHHGGRPSRLRLRRRDLYLPGLHRGRGAIGAKR